MTWILIALAIVYVFVTALVALTALPDWLIHRELARNHELKANPVWIRAEEKREVRDAARRILRSPLWPLFAAAAIGHIYRDSKEDS